MDKHNITYSEHPTRASKHAHKMAKTKFPTYDTSLINPKPSRKPLVILIAAIVLIVAAIVIIVCCITLSGCISNRLPAGQTVDITVEQGDTSSEIANLLEQNNITSASSFLSAVRSKDASSKLKPGTYTVEGGKTDDEYVQMFVDGSYGYNKKIVISEGNVLNSVAQQVEKASDGAITAEGFKSLASDASRYANDYPFLESAGTNSLEGFLYPKTYAYTSDKTADSFIREMLDQFKNATKNLDFSYATNKGYTIYEAVTLASIVEKESAVGYSAKVASVFWNRLDNSIRLQSDATTAYEVGHDPTSAEVHSNSKYSTYSNDGLPPTPICNPAYEALKAVCYPENTNYFYFYFKSVDGQLQYRFSETYEQHQQAIAELS